MKAQFAYANFATLSISAIIWKLILIMENSQMFSNI